MSLGHGQQWFTSSDKIKVYFGWQPGCGRQCWGHDNGSENMRPCEIKRKAVLREGTPLTSDIQRRNQVPYFFNDNKTGST